LFERKVWPFVSSEKMLDHWLHEPAMKEEFLEISGTEADEKTEGEAVHPISTSASGHVALPYFRRHIISHSRALL
jgi:hypothetical protein